MGATRYISAVLLALVTLWANADPTYRHYAVHGLSADAIRQSMTANSPVDGYDAQTEWKVTWNYQNSERYGRCVITSSRVVNNILITLPDWQDQASADIALQKIWQRYFNALVAHERQHAQHGILATSEIQTMLQSFPAQSNCALLNQRVNNAAEAIIYRYSQKDRLYDKNTRHGASEGAIFPNP